MAEITIKFPNEEQRKKLLTAYARTGEKAEDFIAVETGEKEGENTLVEIFSKLPTERKFHNIVTTEAWNETKDDLVRHCLRGEKDGVEYREVALLIEAEEHGHPIQLREGNRAKIEKNYVDFLAKKKMQEEQKVATNNEQTIAPVQTIDNSIKEVKPATEVSAVDTNNMIFTEYTNQPPVTTKEATTPIIPEPIKEVPPVIEPVALEPLNINSIETNPKEMAPTPTAATNIMEAIKTPTDMVSEIKDMPAIEDVQAPLPSIEKQPIIEDSKTIEKSAVEMSYMESFNQSVKKIIEAKEQMQVAYEMMNKAYEQFKNAMAESLQTMENTQKTVENVTESATAKYKEINERDGISRQTFENAQRIMEQSNVVAFNNREEQTLTRVA